MSRADLREEKKRSPEMFSRIHRRYDLMNHLMTFGLDIAWRKRVSRTVASDMAQLVSPDILDLASGTGDMAIALAGRMKTATITLADPSHEMLTAARKKMLRKYCCANISVEDASSLTFRDHSFDALTIAFGVRNFPELEQSLEECFRVLRPGGQIYILEFGRPDNVVINALYQLYSTTVIPLLGWIIAGDIKAYRYLRKSIRTFPFGKRFSGILKEKGFQACSFKRLSAGIVFLYHATKT